MAICGVGGGMTSSLAGVAVVAGAAGGAAEAGAAVGGAAGAAGKTGFAATIMATGLAANLATGLGKAASTGLAAGGGTGPRYCKYPAPMTPVARNPAQNITSPRGRGQRLAGVVSSANDQFEAVLGPEAVMPSTSFRPICN